MSAHVWRFFKTGRVTQVKIENGEDLVHLQALDPKLWSVLSCPIASLRFDARTLALMDTDGDGVIRAPEVREAVSWALARVESPDELFSADEETRERLKQIEAQQADLAKAPPSPEDLAAHKAWEEAPLNDPAILPLGDRTEAAEAALAGVEEVVDAFFAVPDDLPLVTEGPDKVLPLAGPHNPKWQDALAAFVDACARPLLGAAHGREEISRRDWGALKAALAPYRAWRAARPVMAARAKEALLEQERLCRYKLHLVAFLRNFVNQADLYDPRALAVYQTGTLYIDARACSLCFHVDNEAAHAALAAQSKCCLLYARLTRPATGETRTVCAVVTAGQIDALYVGRNGFFIDRDGLDWHAVVTRIVEAHVSLTEAFWSPWKKIFDMLSDQAKKFLATKQTASVQNVGAALTSPIPDASAQANNAATMASSVAALGVGVGMLGAASAGLIGVVAGLPAWKVAAGFLMILLVVSLPSVILTWFKLRARDLGAILNAGGWAVNRPLYFSAALAKTFTCLAPRAIAWGWLVLAACAAVATTAVLFFFLRGSL